MSRVVRSLVFVMVLSSAGSASFLPNFVQGAEFRLHAIHASAFDFFGRLFRSCRHRRDLAIPLDLEILRAAAGSADPLRREIVSDEADDTLVIEVLSEEAHVFVARYEALTTPDAQSIAAQ